MSETSHLSKTNSDQKVELAEGWTLFKTRPAECVSPEDIESHHIGKFTAQVPSTVAMHAMDAGEDIWHPSYDFDDYDWWYCLNFADNEHKTFAKILLNFEGLATLTTVWLNGELILDSDNMYRGFEVDITQRIQSNNTLVILFHSKNNFLTQRHPRPRWKTKLVDNQNMRWLRATVLGHVDVWTPPIKAVGPWRPIHLVYKSDFDAVECSVRTYAKNNKRYFELDGKVTSLDVDKKWTYRIELNGQSYPVNINECSGNSDIVSSYAEVEDCDLWWPHTHGKPTCYEYQLVATSNEMDVLLKSEKIGFKSIRFDEQLNQLLVNGEPIFCRGTCWTLSDYRSLNSSYDNLLNHLTLLKDAGVNMIRVGGTMIYESDDFYSICDFLGILVWQDFMFASMDYPFEDEVFYSNIIAEVNYQLQRLQFHPSISVFCGNTDVEAQAAMFGMPREIWTHAFYTDVLSKACGSSRKDAHYFPSSPTGGVMPFHLNEGVSHYWGTGAYMHTFPDSDAFSVRFCSEGMGLSHIPVQQTINQVVSKQTLFPYCNDWTKRIPRDLGAGWDFDDIREHYLREVFKVDPIFLKRSDVDRYIKLSKIVTGYVIAKTYESWRRHDSQCNGGLIWFNKDFWPCAGFGIIDSNDIPKPAYYLIAQSWQTQSVIITQDGLNGSYLTVINESSEMLECDLVIELFKELDVSVADTSVKISVASNQKIHFSLEALFDRFLDPSYSYRFGQPQFDIIVAKLMRNTKLISDSVCFTHSINLSPAKGSSLKAELVKKSETNLELSLYSEEFLQFVELDFKGFTPEDNYFHLPPGTEKVIVLKLVNDKVNRVKGNISAINLDSEISVKLKE
ncbi:glycoside hydrolase family 2 protein [Pleionea sediminis]|uniref:glycoside hydrolase family 2 protein n=1 Tax=Pleionea sediminis TaxID=2569479 RepID=UPI001185D170|nr:hypothetical protein [Pleionea sediminis]